MLYRRRSAETRGHLGEIDLSEQLLSGLIIVYAIS